MRGRTQIHSTCGNTGRNRPSAGPYGTTAFTITTPCTPRGQLSPSKLPPRKRIAHFVMNLPDSAITFLDAFRGIFAQSLSPSTSDIDLRALYDVMPMVHCHCFTRELDREAAERDIRHVRTFPCCP